MSWSRRLPREKGADPPVHPVTRREGISTKLQDGLLRVAGLLHPDGERRGWHGLLAAALFLAVAVVSARGLPPLDPHWEWLAVAVVMLLVSVGLLATEYRLAGWLIGERVGWTEALRVTILSSAANLLPLPGGLAVRTGALSRKGSPWTSALGSHLVMGLAWLGVSAFIAGVLLLGNTSLGVAGGFLSVGLGILAVTWTALPRLEGRQGVLLAGGVVVGLESVYVLASALRLYAILAGLGIEVTFPQATTLTVASALAAGLGFFPGGLGLRELLAGGLSPLVGMAPAVGAFAGVVDRLVGLLVRGLLAAVIWWLPTDADETREET